MRPIAQPYGAPAMMQGAMMPSPYAQPQVQYAAPQVMQAAQPTVQYAAPAVQAPAVTAPMVAQAAPTQMVAPAAMGSKVYTPVGAEMLQVTVFGTKQLPGANAPSVEIGIDGKPHKHNLDTLAITGPQLTPKTLVTYYLPGENLNFIVSEGGNVLGDVQISGQDFHPAGLEGDLPLMDPQTGNQGPGYLMVKIVPLGVTGKMEDLAPVHIQSEAKIMAADPAPYVASTTQPRSISPEEWQRLGDQGARMVVEEGPMMGAPVAAPVAAPAPVYTQPAPQPIAMQAAQPQMMRPMAQPAVYAGAMPTQAMPTQMYGAPQPMQQQVYMGGQPQVLMR